MRLRWLALLPILGCEVSAVSGVAGSGTSPGAGVTGFSAEYILASVQPDVFVPAAGLTQRSVIGRCVEIKASGTLTMEILYSQDSPAALIRETDSWPYVLSGSDILARDPVGTGSGPVTQRIGSTTATQITITRVLRNNGVPVIRTLNFSKISSLDPRCGN